MKKGMIVIASVGSLLTHTLCAEPVEKYRTVTTTHDWGTHLFCLLTAIANTKGPVLELGSGDYSTPVLHALCKAQNKFLTSIDTDKEWLSYFADMKTPLHQLVHTHNTVDFVKEDATHWGVVFIDQHPTQQRQQSLYALLQKGNADVFVLHDTQEYYWQHDPVLASFKYRYDDDRYRVHATVVSNVVDVREWFKLASITVPRNNDIKTPFEWGTHMASLTATVANTTGPVLELGCGHFSTPLLHTLCTTLKKELYTIETSKYWMPFFLDLESDLHHFYLTKDPLQYIDQDTTHWGMVFIDQASSEEGHQSLKALLKKGNADVFVIHDTQEFIWCNSPYLSTFKYRYDDTRYRVQTTVVSNVIDVCTWFVD